MAMTSGMPLILFNKEVPNIYTPVAPVYVVDDEPENGQFLSVYSFVARSCAILPDRRHQKGCGAGEKS